MQNIRMDIVKGTEEGKTSINAGSPTRSNMGSPSLSRKGAVILSYGAVVTKQTLNVGTNELAQGGNERLANGIENAVTGLGIIGAAVYTGGVSLGVTAIQGAGDTISLALNNRRENRRRATEEQLTGSRVTYNTGSGYE